MKKLNYVLKVIQKKNLNTYLLHYYLTTIDDITFRITFM